ncbi:PRC-barrel domain-containing protein [Methylocella sp.]|uniref:PRC-barrel domain-containing protein n=1 Tax=Methylocella sp. TaxID=1978226 RepID=UPI0037844BD9
MKLALLASAALLAPTLAFAETPAAAHADITRTLHDAGYSDVTVINDAVLVKAKDKTGSMVTLAVSPNHMTKVSSYTFGDKAEGRSATHGAFLSIPAGGEMSSRLIGTNIYNRSNEDIGEIKDVVFGKNGLEAFVVGVGGFLGMGEHYVAVDPSAITLSYDGGKISKGVMDADKAQLKAAPEFKYPGDRS